MRPMADAMLSTFSPAIMLLSSLLLSVQAYEFLSASCISIFPKNSQIPNWSFNLILRNLLVAAHSNRTPFQTNVQTANTLCNTRIVSGEHQQRLSMENQNRLVDSAQPRPFSLNKRLFTNLLFRLTIYNIRDIKDNQS